MIIRCWFEDSIRLNEHFVFIDFFYCWSIYSRIFFFLSCIFLFFWRTFWCIHPWSFIILDKLLVKVIPKNRFFFLCVSKVWIIVWSSLPCSEYENCKVLHALHRNTVPFPKGTSWRSKYFPWISHRLHQWNLFFCISASESMAVWKEREI